MILCSFGFAKIMSKAKIKRNGAKIILMGAFK
jgi:hypothetical protein